MRTYTQLTREQRYQIYVLLEGEPIQSEIAEIIKVHKSPISRKLRRNRGKCYGSNNRRGQIKDRVSIEERPEVVDERSHVGDWEADTVIGRPGGAGHTG